MSRERGGHVTAQCSKFYNRERGRGLAERSQVSEVREGFSKEMSKFKKHRRSSWWPLNTNGMIIRPAGRSSGWNWMAVDLEMKLEKVSQGPDLIKTLCHPEKFVLECVSREMPTLDHNDFSHVWPGLEHSLHILLM